MSNEFKYTVEVKGAPEIPGEGKPRRNVWFADKLIDHPEGVLTMWDNFLHGVKESADRPGLGVRKVEDGVPGDYEWQTYDEVFKRVTNFGAGLEAVGLERQKSLGFYSVNRPEWTMAEQACYKHSFINVALYDTLGKDSIVFIVNQTEMEYILASADKISQILAFKPELPTVKCIVCMDDDVNEDLISQAEDIGVSVITFKDLEKLGIENHKETYEPPKPDDIGTICYTSGTTGLPKGAVLTQAQMLAPVSSVLALAHLGKYADISKIDVHMSYLPLAHCLERAVQATMINVGAAIGYYQGDTLKLLDDVAVLKPTIFVSVPRLFNRIYDRVLASVKAKGIIASTLFDIAFAAKKENLQYGYSTHWIWDKLVFAPVKARLGGRLRFMLSGSAPISPDVMDFLRICFSVEVFEGYGQTENFVGGCMTLSGDMEAGHVGPPFGCSEIKLVDVPDMNYTSKDQPYPRGEICIRGNSIQKEYYKNPEKTAEAVGEDGWLHTGDIGLWDDKGRIRIIDRLKNIFKLAQGEYIAPEKVESVYQKHHLVAQAYVHGDSLQSTVVAIIVPDEHALKHFAAESEELPNLPFEELCKSPIVKKYVLKEITTFGKQNDLKGFENVKNIYLESREFSIANDLLTPTFKLKRDIAKKYYLKKIDEMYAEINQA